MARSNVYNRIKDLGIETVKQGRKAFVTAADLELLDGLHAHLGRGGTTLGFVQIVKKKGHLALSTIERPASYITERSQESDREIAINPVALVSTIETVVKRMIPQSTRRLTYLEELESAYQKGVREAFSEMFDPD